MKKLAALLFLLISITGYSQIPGTWKGYMKLSEKDSLALVLVVEQRGDTLHLELDSPDQYAFQIQTDQSSWQNDTVRFAVKKIGVSYIGTFNIETETIDGVFTQFKTTYPMVLRKIEEGRVIPNRPQTPQPPYPYNIDDKIVYFENRTPVVTGTLTWPEEGKPKAVVVLISGSGWQDRDETMFLHKPFLVMADYLTRLGYAVFRYDDLPRAKYMKATTKDFAFYAGMIVDSLKRDERCAGVPIGFLGHSEGGLIATMCASERDDIAFIISLAGVSVPLADLLVFQGGIAAKNAGFTEEEIHLTNKMNTTFYQLVKKSSSPQKAVATIEKWYNKTVSGLTEKEMERYQFTNNKLIELKQTVLNPWMYELIKIDPVKYIKKCDLPLLALNGSLDMQVEAKPNLSAFEKNIPPNPRNRFIELPGLNHLFQEAGSGNVDEYGKIEQTLSPEVLEIIGNWLP